MSKRIGNFRHPGWRRGNAGEPGPVTHRGEPLDGAKRFILHAAQVPDRRFASSGMTGNFLQDQQLSRSPA
jgi:hypothetical protein